MCGRFVGNFNTDDLLAEIEEAALAVGLNVEMPGDHLQLSHNFNTAPTQGIPVLRVESETLIVDGMFWGLLPVWSKDPSAASKMINARSETITEKPSFKNLVPNHRCIIPMSGFYEWDRSNAKAKVPYYVTRADGHLMLGAGLWTRSPLLDNNHTCALITRESVEDLSHIHNRSPVEFNATDAIDWLTLSPPPLEMMWSDGQPTFATTRVSTLVNAVRNNGPSLIEPFTPPVVEDEEPDTLF
ncbi:MAG: SOS response-associated peptidase [Actinomycetes bacterium]